MKRKYFNPIILFRRIVFEFLHPQNFYLKKIKKYFIIFNKNNNSKNKYEFFYAIYDLEVSAVTFNFVEFLVMCNNHLLENNYKYFIVIFIEKDEKSINSGEFDSKINALNKKWRLYEVLIPLMKFCKNCKGHLFLPNRAHYFKYVKNVNTYPEDYSISNISSIGLDELKHLYKKNNIESCSLKSNETHLNFVENWLKTNKLNKNKTVVISIRDTPFDIVRNSKLNEWIKFTNFLTDLNYQVIIIPDNDSKIDYFSKFNKCKIVYEAAYSVSFRFVLSEIVFLNLYVSHGPSLLSVFNMKSDYAIFNIQPKNNSFTDTFEAYKQIGWEYNKDFKFAKKKQKLIWEEDTFENLKENFIKYFNN